MRLKLDRYVQNEDIDHIQYLNLFLTTLKKRFATKLTDSTAVVWNVLLINHPNFVRISCVIPR